MVRVSRVHSGEHSVPLCGVVGKRKERQHQANPRSQTLTLSKYIRSKPAFHPGFSGRRLAPHDKLPVALYICDQLI